jgi:TRAP-type C4-dicarboxylate transport system permease large subunit
VLMGDKRGGVPAAIAGGVLAFFSMMFCEYLLLSDGLAKYLASHNQGPVSINSAMFLDYLRHLDIIDWVCIAIGVYGGAKTPLRARR